MNDSKLPQLTSLAHTRFQPLLLIIVILGTTGTIAILSENHARVLLVLLLGVPFTLPILSRQGRRIALPLLIGLVPLTGILKAITGSRFAPLTFDLGLLVACLFHIAYGVLRGKLRMGKLDLLLGLLWALAFVQIWNPNVPGIQAGIEGFRKFMYMSVAFYAGRHMLRGRDLERFRKITLIVAFLVSLYGLKQFIVLWPVDLRMVDLATSSRVTYFMGGWIRPFSTLPGPFHLGLYISITALLTTAFLFRVRRWGTTQGLLAAFLLLQIAVLIMTRTKGNWVGFVVGIIVLLTFQSRSFLRSFFKTIRFLIVLVLLVTGILIISSGTIARVLSEAVAAVLNPLQSPTFIFRVELWRAEILPALAARPLIGYGTSSAGEGLSNLYEGTSSSFFFSHNLFIKVWLELGLVGVALFLLLVGISLAIGMRQLILMRRQPPAVYPYYQWAAAVVVTFLVAGLVIPTLDAYPANYYFWLLLGILTTDRRIHE